MKKILCLYMLFIPLFLSAQVQREFNPKTIYVTFDKTKHIVFPTHVSDIDFGREDLVAIERVEQAPHIIKITAQEENFTDVTNLTVVCIDGDVYTFKIYYLPKGMSDVNDNIVYAGNITHKRSFYSIIANCSYATDIFLPADIIYVKQGNEEIIKAEYYNNILKVGTTFDTFPESNLFVVDKDLNNYEITINPGKANSYSYNFDDERKYIAHINVNDIEMKNIISQIRPKKRNIYSLGVIKNKFEMSLVNLYVVDDFMFFVFDIKNFSNINYDIDFVKCFQRDIKKIKHAIQQELQVEPVYQKDFYNKIYGKSDNRFIIAFNKFTIPDDKVFEIEMFEKGGGRHIKLSILNEYILKADKLK